MGIEPTSEAWEASILPLYDARSPATDYTQGRQTSNSRARWFFAAVSPSRIDDRWSLG